MPPEPIATRRLGQSGFRFEAAGTVIYVDPYLSDSVAEREGPHLRRQIPIPILPENVIDAHVVCITHAHPDHCDDATLLPLSTASPACCFVCPAEVAEHLVGALHIPPTRIVVATEAWIDLGSGVRVRAIPAAHPRIERDAQGNARCVGYLFESGGRRVYHSGDCSVDPEQVAILKGLLPIDVAFLPVNERNFYREQLGIIGNMSVREAFGFAADLGVRMVVPMHYDMFQPNAVYPDEIREVYERERPPFSLVFDPLSV
jgi:L-ascorbate 6-phosphate lactonase